jgi:hypothetical protein
VVVKPLKWRQPRTGYVGTKAAALTGLVRGKELIKGSAHMVGERSVGLRRCLETDAGGIRSANADMSSDKGSERLPRRKPKVSCATFIGAG